MEKKILLKRVFTLVVFILIANILAGKFFWYSSIWYFDMIMHFLGGLWLSFVLVYVYLFVLKKEIKSYVQMAFFIIISALIIGILWEIFEVVVSALTTSDKFNVLDTASDIFFDLSGAIAGSVYFLTKMDNIKLKW